MSETKNIPYKEYRSGCLSMAAWRNEVKDGDRTFVQFSIRFQKRIRDRKTQEWKTTEYLFVNELPKLILIAQKMFEGLSMSQPDEGFDPEKLEEQNPE